MKLRGNEVIIDKEEFLTNILTTGVLCQWLEKKTGIPMMEWAHQAGLLAQKQYDEMTPEQRDAQIKTWVELSQAASQ